MESKPLPSYVAEFVGTLILVLIGCGGIVLSGPEIGDLGISLNFGLTVLMLSYVLGPISGCHINPAVTFALALTGKFPKIHGVAYIIAQLLGGIAGAALVFCLASDKVDFNASVNFASNGFGDLSPQQYSMHAVGLVEVLITTLWVLVFLATTSRRFAQGFAGIVIGSTVAVIHSISLPISHSSANFARSLGTAIFQGGVAPSQLWVFAAAHIIAVGLAVGLYKFIFPTEIIPKIKRR